ncbi:MAG: hypothetical protein HY717_22285 [Planctomycetes bacterium]|nr:hypothetical protein [Planctomycetota bacterium]
MTREPLQSQPPDPKASPSEGSPFPLFLFLLATVSLCGFYHQFLIEVPGELLQHSFKQDLPARLVEWLDQATVAIGSRPILALLIFLISISPGLVFYEQARKYYYILSVCAVLLWGTSFVLSERPAKRLGTAIHQILSMGREFPETIHGQ